MTDREKMLNKNLKFLIVNDLSSMQEIIKKMLREIGFINIDEAEGGAEALRKLQQGAFDFVISDWHMSKMDGLTMLQTVRATKMLKDIPVLMVTEKVNKINILAAARAGANGDLIRPFSRATLNEKLNIIYKNIENCTYSSIENTEDIESYV